VQTGAPVAQEIAPVLQTWPDSEQLAPAVHEAQVPLLQTMLVPQAVPLAWDCWVSVQVDTPSEQVVWPT
jgi:hypothetical protein